MKPVSLANPRSRSTAARSEIARTFAAKGAGKSARPKAAPTSKGKAAKDASVAPSEQVEAAPAAQRQPTLFGHGSDLASAPRDASTETSMQDTETRRPEEESVAGPLLKRGPQNPTIRRSPTLPAPEPNSERELGELGGVAVPATTKVDAGLTGSAPLRSWHELPRQSNAARSRARVPSEVLTVPSSLPCLPAKPADATGLIDLLPEATRRALLLGITSREPSFHVFVAVDPSLKIEDDLVRFAEKCIVHVNAPDDVVYVHDFDRPHAPRPLLLPAGTGSILSEMMDALVDRLREEIPATLDGDSIQDAFRELGRTIEEQNKKALHGLEATAKSLGFGIRNVPGGMQTFPILHGKPLSAEQFSVLDESTKRALSDAEDRLTKEVERAALMVRSESKKFEVARAEAESEVVKAVVERALGELREALASAGQQELLSRSLTYLSQVGECLTREWEDLLPQLGARDAKKRVRAEEEHESGEHEEDPELATSAARFRVNVLVSRAADEKAQVIYEQNPTFSNLFGYLERRAKFGALLTDFSRIRAGVLHRAFGGILIVRVQDLLADPIIWERLKRALRERQLSPEDPVGPLGLYATTLRPVPVPLAVRMVLVGPPQAYAALLDADPDFASLFRVKVEIEGTVTRNAQTITALDAVLMQMASERQWGEFDKHARARLVDLASRLSGEQYSLALGLGPIEEAAAFASALAVARTQGLTDAPSSLQRPFDAASKPAEGVRVTEEDVAISWRERRERTGAAERHFREMILRGEIAVETDKARVGVINGLSVLSTGDVEFGQPMRITAVVSLGREGLIDVDREAQLSGAIHTKGVAILRGYLGKLFGQERPVSLRAQLAFEQSYGEVDGDSASAAELFALVSALAEVPIDQSIAVTGSINQLGAVQSVGGVCAKIEGFFDVCMARGMTGAQGVVIPRANLLHLVLRDDVVQAIREKKFHLYAIDQVAQGVEILTGLPCGERDESGRFPASSVFGRVERRLIEISERLREAEQPARPEVHEDVSVSDLGDEDGYR
jgi:predicted ATP-dependent protease